MTAHITCFQWKEEKNGGLTLNARIPSNNIVLPNNEDFFFYFFFEESFATKKGELWTDTCTAVVRLEAML